MISAAVIRPDEALKLPWDDLRPFARNVFMNPVALKTAADTMLAAIYVLVAWDASIEPARLVGFWALQSKQLLIWPFLEALPFNYAFLSTPILHPDYADEAMPALLGLVARDGRLPDVIVAHDLDAAGREHSALFAAIGAHPQSTLREIQRPIATRDLGIKRSGSTRKKLRQNWNRLSEAGEVAIENIRDPARIADAFEDFLTLEAAGWKGQGGTALLNDRRDAAFARRLIGELAREARASVAVLTLGGRTIATQVVLYSGRIAYTWKTSFDPGYARFSPGALLIDRLAAELIDAGDVDLIDSCADGAGFMGQLLLGRKPMVDVVFSATPRRSIAFSAVGSYLALRETMKRWRNRLRRGGPRADQPSRPRTSSGTEPEEPGTVSPAPTIDRAA